MRKKPAKNAQKSPKMRKKCKKCAIAHFRRILRIFGDFLRIFGDFLRIFWLFLRFFSPFLLKKCQILGERGGGDGRAPKMGRGGGGNKMG